MLTLGASFHVPSILLSLFSWSSFYVGLRHLEPYRKAEWHCRIVTACHAALISVITGWATFVQGPWPFTDAGGHNTPLQVTATTICLGYFLFDFAWCLYFQTEGFTMLLHHSLSVFGFVWSLCAGKYGTELMATICGSEVTNPLLQLRWFLKETGRYNTVLGEVVDVVFMLSFFFIRIGVGSVLIYCYFQQPTDFMGRVGATSIYLISWMFWISIFQYAVHKYTKRYRARTKPDDGRDTRQLSSPSHTPSTDEKHENRDSVGAQRDGTNLEGDPQQTDNTSMESISSADCLWSASQNGLHHRSGSVQGNGAVASTFATDKEECHSRLKSN